MQKKYDIIFTNDIRVVKFLACFMDVQQSVIIRNETVIKFDLVAWFYKNTLKVDTFCYKKIKLLQ